ncbi:MAG: 4'-phosphopantetheinyl transferase superfamily protein, partial [Proteobacteria bacterium]|nr:4'-phosphopantetheinyl transferase superfamily protein [Pseudomonadota bacterium]
MIYGIGTDIVEISRIKNMKSRNSFAEKILSEDELKISSDFNNEKY